MENAWKCMKNPFKSTLRYLYVFLGGPCLFQLPSISRWWTCPMSWRGKLRTPSDNRRRSARCSPRLLTCRLAVKGWGDLEDLTQQLLTSYKNDVICLSGGKGCGKKKKSHDCLSRVLPAHAWKRGAEPNPGRFPGESDKTESRGKTFKYTRSSSFWVAILFWLRDPKF